MKSKLSKLLILVLLVGCNLTKKNDHTIDQATKNKLDSVFSQYQFVDSTQILRENEIKCYLSFADNNLNWEEIFSSVIRNEIILALDKISDFRIEIFYPKKTNDFNFYEFKSYHGLYSNEILEYYRFILLNFSPQDFNYFNEGLHHAQNYYNDSCFNVKFSDIVVGVVDTNVFEQKAHFSPDVYIQKFLLWHPIETDSSIHLKLQKWLEISNEISD